MSWNAVAGLFYQVLPRLERLQRRVAKLHLRMQRAQDSESCMGFWMILLCIVVQLSHDRLSLARPHRYLTTGRELSKNEYLHVRRRIA